MIGKVLFKTLKSPAGVLPYFRLRVKKYKGVYFLIKFLYLINKLQGFPPFENVGKTPVYCFFFTLTIFSP